MYRKLPKLKGIAGGNRAGINKYVTVNLADLVGKFSEGEEVTLDALKAKGVLRPSSKEKKLPLKVLAKVRKSEDTEQPIVPPPLTIHATAFSEAAKEQIAAMGGKMVDVPKKIKWTRKAAKAAGKSK